MRHGALNGGVVIAGLMLVACQAVQEDTSAAPSASATSASPSGTVAPAASIAAESGVETSVFDLEIGDCFSLTSLESVETVTVVPCDEPHIYEAFAVLEHSGAEGDPFPGDEEMIGYADEACQEPFEAYVGRDYASSEFYITSVYPSAETWGAGDREVVCTLNLEDESEVTGTAQGSGR